MMEPSLEVQKLIRLRLVATSALTALVPASSIVDRSGIPSTFPSILVGEGQTVAEEGLSRRRHVTYFDIHVWAKETGLVTVKQIAGTIRDALFDSIWTIPGLHVADFCVTGSRFIRNPNGWHSHAIIGLQAFVVETTS